MTDMKQIDQIAQEVLGISDLDHIPYVRMALEAAYTAGRTDGHRMARATAAAEIRGLGMALDDARLEGAHLKAALIRIAEIDPEDGTQWFRDVADAAIVGCALEVKQKRTRSSFLNDPIIRPDRPRHNITDV